MLSTTMMNKNDNLSRNKEGEKEWERRSEIEDDVDVRRELIFEVVADIGDGE